MSREFRYWKRIKTPKPGDDFYDYMNLRHGGLGIELITFDWTEDLNDYLNPGELYTEIYDDIDFASEYFERISHNEYLRIIKEKFNIPDLYDLPPDPNE